MKKLLCYIHAIILFTLVIIFKHWKMYSKIYSYYNKDDKKYLFKSDISVDNICKIVKRVFILIPANTTCVQRALVAFCLLKRNGYKPILKLGYSLVPIEMHTWIEIDNEVVFDSPKVSNIYFRINKFNGFERLIHK